MKFLINKKNMNICHRGFRPGQTQTGLNKMIARGLKFRVEEVAKPMALISCAAAAKLICVFVFAYMLKAGFLMTRFICPMVSRSFSILFMLLAFYDSLIS